jgi:hypothetical protein
MVQLAKAEEISQTTYPLETQQTLVAINTGLAEIIELFNPIELIGNLSKFLYYPKFIDEDKELTTRGKLFLTKIFNLLVGQQTYKPILSDSLIASDMDISEKSVRNWINKLSRLGKIYKQPIYGTGTYHLSFRYHPSLDLTPSQRITLEIEKAVSAAKTRKTRTTTETSGMARTLSLVPTQAEAPGAAQPPTQLEQASLAQSQELTDHSLTPPVSSVIKSALPISAQTLEAPEQLPQAEQEAEASQEKEINNVVSMKVDNEARVATFGSQLLGQDKQQTKAQAIEEKLEQAERLFAELDEEQEESLFSLNTIIQEHWEKTGTIDQLQNIWEQSSSDRFFDFDDYVAEKVMEQIKVLYAKEYLIFSLDYPSKQAKNLAINSLLTKWSVSTPQPEQLNTVDIIIKPSNQNAELLSSSLEPTFQSNTTLSPENVVSRSNQEIHVSLEPIFQSSFSLIDSLEPTFQSSNEANLENQLSTSVTTLEPTFQSEPIGSLEPAFQSFAQNNLPKTTAFAENVRSNGEMNEIGTSNSTLATSFSPISTILTSTYSLVNVEGTTATIDTSNSNLLSHLAPSTTPTSNDTSTCFKALKLSFLVDLNHDLEEKEEEKEEEKKSLSLSLAPSSGTNNSSSTITTTGTNSTDTSTSNTNTSTNNNNTSTNSPINTTASSSSDTRKAKLLSDLKTNFGYDPSQVETVTRGDKSCVYCLGEGKLYKTISAVIRTNKGEKEETFRDQNFIPCQCAKLYDMLEFVVGNLVVVGIPKLTDSQLAIQQQLISDIDEKLKAKAVINQQIKSNSVKPKEATKQPENQAKAQAKTEPQQPKSQVASKEAKRGVADITKGKETKFTTNQTNTSASSDKPNVYGQVKNYEQEKVALDENMLALIEHLNSTASERLNNRGYKDLLIEVTSDKKHCIIPNKYDQARTSQFEFLDWLLYGKREPNTTCPVRFACAGYYLGAKEDEMRVWIKQRAELGIGGSLGLNVQSNSPSEPNESTEIHQDINC